MKDTKTTGRDLDDSDVAVLCDELTKDVANIDVQAALTKLQRQLSIDQTALLRRRAHLLACSCRASPNQAQTIHPRA
eukprot:1757149-Pleurochrysis_carterae.AAC.1